MDSRRTFIKQLSVGAAACAVLPMHDVFAQTAASTVTIACASDVPSWDPSARIASTPMSIYRAVFDQPMEYSADGKLSPAVVTKYEWQAGGKQLQLTLRDDVFFSNGDKLTARDFRFTFFERPKADKSLQMGFLWKEVTDIEIKSPTLLVMHFSEPKVTAPQDMASLGAFILPKDYFEKVGLDGFLAKPVGSGPYRLTSYARDSRIVLEAVDKHWRGPAKIRNLAWQVVKNPTARSAALQSGQVDLVTDLPVRETLRLATLSGDKSAVTPTPDMYIIQMTNLGPLKEKAVRLAMHMAIDKAAISRAFFNNVATPLFTPAAPGTPAFQPDFKFPFSVADATAQLATVGISPAKPVALKFYATNGVYPNDYDVARAIVQMWQKVGINATLQVIELAEYFTRAGAGTLDGPVLWFWSNATGDPAKGPGTFLNPKKVFSVWKSQDISDHLEPLLVEMDYDKRIAGFKAFDVWAVQQGYTLPLLQGVATVAYKKTVPYKPFSSGQILPYYWSA